MTASIHLRVSVGEKKGNKGGRKKHGEEDRERRLMERV